MAIYCVDDGGDGTQTNSTQSASTLDWSKADTSIANLISYDAAALTTSGNIIFFGHDHAGSQSGAWTLTGPTSGTPVVFISADRTTSTPTFLKSQTNQIENTTSGNLIFDGAFALYGMRCKSAALIQFNHDVDEPVYTEQCDFVPAANSYLYLSPGSYASSRHVKVNVDLSADASSGRSTAPIVVGGPAGDVEICGLTFLDTSGSNTAQYRTGTVIGYDYSGKNLTISGADFSGFSNATTCELVEHSTFVTHAVLNNCRTVASPTYSTAVTAGSGHRVTFYNVGPADDPAHVYMVGGYGTLDASTAVDATHVYRTGGATVESGAVSWLITTTATCSEGSPFVTPWIYGTIDSTGSKTWTLYVENTTADFTDAELWLEVEYLSVSDEADWILATDRRVIGATAANQADDTGSTWNGENLTYKQSLAVTATVNETGQYRARVACGVTSMAASRKCYIDPKVTVS